MRLAPSTIATNISSIRKFHEFAVVEHYAPSNPAELVELPRQADKLPEVLNTAEIEKILSQPDQTCSAGIRDYAILETLYATGMRASELITLATDDRVFETGYIRSTE